MRKKCKIAEDEVMATTEEDLFKIKVYNVVDKQLNQSMDSRFSDQALYLDLSCIIYFIYIYIYERMYVCPLCFGIFGTRPFSYWTCVLVELGVYAFLQDPVRRCVTTYM